MRQVEATVLHTDSVQEEKSVSLRHLSAARRRALRTLCEDGPASASDIARIWRATTPLTAREHLIERLLWVLESLGYAEPAQEPGLYRATARGARALRWH